MRPLLFVALALLAPTTLGVETPSKLPAPEAETLLPVVGAPPAPAGNAPELLLPSLDLPAPPAGKTRVEIPVLPKV